MNVRPVLTLEGVTQRHRIGRHQETVLDHISLELWPGEIVAILGPRRSGKTTLLRVAAGIEAPAAGSVRLDGAALGGLRGSARTQRLRAVGYAPKEWRVARGKPVLDHVALPLLAEGRPLLTALAQAHEALERVGAPHCAGAQVEELAPGDEPRVALAQALVREPRVLLVDEPGAIAAPEEREELLGLLRGIAADDPQLALAVTTRDAAGLAGARRVLTLDGGVLRETSATRSADVLPFPGRLATEAAPAR